MVKTISYVKALIPSIVLVVVVITLGACQPKADFEYLSGESGRLEDLRGKWIIINFWAEWCAPCRTEVEVLSEIEDKGLIPNLSIIGISYDPLDTSTLKQIVAKWGFSYPVIATKPVPFLPFSLPNKLPALYILSPELELVAKVSGEQNLESINKLLNSLQNKTN